MSEVPLYAVTSISQLTASSPTVKRRVASGGMSGLEPFFPYPSLYIDVRS